MGWIFNGSDFVKANKAQREAFNKVERDNTIKTFFSNPLIFPTIALFVAGGFLGLKLLDWINALTLPSLPELPDFPSTADISQELQEDPGYIILLPLDRSRFEQDMVNCAASIPGTIGQAPFVTSNPLRGAQMAACMLKKGWEGDLVFNALRKIADTFPKL